MSFGPWQLLLVLAIVILLFGAGRIPRLMGDLAKGIRSFKAGMKDESQEEEQPQAQAQPRQIDAEATPGSTTTTGSTSRQDETART
jgi:sec-independent protein translocase protein TatA